MSTWHAPPDALARFARAPEGLDDLLASSIEEHLVGCPDCRALVAASADPVVLARSWSEVADVIDRPAATVMERGLRRLGVPADTSRLVGATAGLRIAWFATVGVVGSAAVAAARADADDAVFLAIAPLVALGAVAVTFLAAEQPAGEAGGATPLHGAGLVLRRALAVLAPTFLLLTLTGLAQPDRTAGGAAWVLPGLALTLGALALATIVRVGAATAIAALAWIGLLVAVAWSDGPGVHLAHRAPFDAIGQLIALALALLAAVVLYARRDHFSTWGVPW